MNSQSKKKFDGKKIIQNTMLPRICQNKSEKKRVPEINKANI